MEKIRASEKNVILLDGGDTYQGNMWFGYYKGTAAVTFMNYTKYDVMVSFHKTIIQTLTISGRRREEGTKVSLPVHIMIQKFQGLLLCT